MLHELNNIKMTNRNVDIPLINSLCRVYTEDMDEPHICKVNAIVEKIDGAYLDLVYMDRNEGSIILPISCLHKSIKMLGETEYE